MTISQFMFKKVIKYMTKIFDLLKQNNEKLCMATIERGTKFPNISKCILRKLQCLKTKFLEALWRITGFYKKPANVTIPDTLRIYY